MADWLVAHVGGFLCVCSAGIRASARQKRAARFGARLGKKVCLRLTMQESLVCAILSHSAAIRCPLG